MSRLREHAFLVVVGLVLPVCLFTGCGGADNCAGPAVEGTFTGRLTSMRGDVATFVVESAPAPAPPGAPRVGRTLTVRYPQHDGRFLHVGDRYRVAATSGNGAQLVSSINRPCVAGTTWPDGSYIRTGSWWKQNAMLVFLLGLPGAVLLVAAVVAWRRAPNPGSEP